MIEKEKVFECKGLVSFLSSLLSIKEAITLKSFSNDYWSPKLLFKVESIISLNFMFISIFINMRKLLDLKAPLFSFYKRQLFTLKFSALFRPTFIRLFSAHKEKNFLTLKVFTVLLGNFLIALDLLYDFLKLPTNTLRELHYVLHDHACIQNR